jgi:hypothetical protein
MSTAVYKYGDIYSVFYRFRQAKFAHGGSILRPSQFFATARVSKNNTPYDSGQN